MARSVHTVPSLPHREMQPVVNHTTTSTSMTFATTCRKQLPSSQLLRTYQVFI